MEYEGVQLVVNGEIWNYPTLRKEYESRGYTFKSNSDSEIILFLYKEGELNRLDGMFSFVIYDGNKLLLSRDWVGKLPLYILNNNEYIIASEIKAITTKTKSSKPVRKVGSEVPINTKTVLAVSADLPRNLAATTPRVIPTINHKIIAPIAKEAVTGSACPINVVTHSCSLNEYPRLGAGQLIAAAPSP
jgi:asparagine synthetase B (glutamine-hydrolysing)